MGLSYRTARLVATSLLLVAAVGGGGLAGMSPVLAADPGKVSLSGTLVDAAGTPLPGVQMTIEEVIPPDGAIAAFAVTTGADGAFAIDVFAWGTSDAVAALSIKTAADAQVQLADDNCATTWSVAADVQQAIAYADAAPEPLTVIAATAILGQVCGTTATPAPGGPATGGGGPGLTPPPTDSLASRPASESDRSGPALAIGFGLGLLSALALLTPRRGARRRG